MIDDSLTPFRVLDIPLRTCACIDKIGNYVHDNADAGLSIMESSNCVLYDNEVVNHDTGVRIVLGGEFNEVRDNVFKNCRKCKFCIIARLITCFIGHTLTVHGR